MKPLIAPLTPARLELYLFVFLLSGMVSLFAMRPWMEVWLRPGP